MPDNLVAVADSTSGTVQITVYFPAPTGSPVHIFRVHQDGSEHEVLGSPIVMSDGFAVVYDNGAPMDTPVYYIAYTTGGLVAYSSFSYVVTDHWNPGTLNLPGGSGNYASTPDAASLDIVGDIELRAEVSFSSWTPATEQTMVSKWNTTGNQRSYHLSLLPTGHLRLGWSTNGTAVTNADSTEVTGFQPELIRFIRTTLDVSSGEVRFFTSDHGGGFIQLGDPVIVGATSIFASTATVGVGAKSAGTADVMVGRMYAAQIRNGIAGTIVADPKFKEYGPTVTSFNDSTGKTWTVNGTAAIIEFPINIDWDLTAGAFTEFDVNGTVGQQTATAANQMRWAMVNVGLTDVTASATVSISQAPITGAAATARMWARAGSSSDYYEANLNFNTSGTVTLVLGKRVATVFTQLAGPFTVASSFVANEQFRISLEVEGPEIRTRAWPIATSLEPDWQLASSDLSLTTQTLVALANRREGGNTNANLVFSWDNFVVSGPAAEAPAVRCDTTSSRMFRAGLARVRPQWTGYKTRPTPRRAPCGPRRRWARASTHCDSTTTTSSRPTCSRGATRSPRG